MNAQIILKSLYPPITTKRRIIRLYIISSHTHERGHFQTSECLDPDIHRGAAGARLEMVWA